MANIVLISIARSYTAYRLNSYKEAVKYLNTIIGNKSIDEDIRQYFACVARYLILKNGQVKDEVIKSILYKFFEEQYVNELYEKLDQGLSPYNGYLLKCDMEHCDTCNYRKDCKYNEIKEMYKTVGQEYKKFVNGQAREEFAID